jgi:gliding motility-associated-like protein
MNRLVLLFLMIALGPIWAQDSDVTMRPNRGQWDDRIDYSIPLQGGKMYLEQHGFTYFFYDVAGHNHANSSHNEPQAWAVKTIFVDAQQSDQKLESQAKAYYRNYFIGNDPSSWRSEIHDIQEVIYKEKYPRIDLHISTVTNQAKYSWIILPGGDVNSIRWNYEGYKNVQIEKDGQLRVEHGFGYFLESKPIAWKLVNGKKIPLDVQYVKRKNSFAFQLESNYSSSDTLVIDPSLTFSSFTGSLSDNWGFTAAPDPTGNLYSGGIVFGTGYPATTGAVSQVFNGGTPTPNAPTTSPLHNGFDVGVSKFNATGTAFLFSTYLGGSANETPHSIVSDALGNMYLLGVTSSVNFPTLATCFDNSFNGGPTVSPDNLHFIGSDIYVIELNPNGTAILASTYIGGSGIDGISFGNLQYNYGDNFRGEIIVDQNFVYFSSVTQSSDFPIVSGSQATLNGIQDAVVVKMPKNLSSIIWSTYYGGSSDETGNGIALSSNGTIYVAGGTMSSDLNLGASGWDPTYGANRDGFLTRFNGSTGSVMNGTYVGTADYDQCYFVQVDQDDDVYMLGQTAGNWAITPGCYGTAGSGQMIMKFSANLTNQLWVTTVGAGTGNIELSPTAFLVSNCKDIYLSGWGGAVNSGNSQATTSSSNGMPLTLDAFQSTTAGNNFWIAVLSQNAGFLKYATYIGGTSSSYNHVDGGTSRFDKNGNIYHAVCGACGGNNFGFTTTPGVIGPENLSVNCNLAAFKFELTSIEAVVVAPDPLICLPDPVIFQNNSANGNAFFWDFGDGTSSTQVNPTHVYAGPGQYTVMLTVIDTAQCYSPDSLEFIVNIGDFNGGVVAPQVFTCNGQPAQIEAFGGSSYLWSPAQFLNNSTIANPIATVNQNTTFTCIISDSCGVDTVFVEVLLQTGNLTISNDTTICLGQSAPLEVAGIIQVMWTPAQFLDDPTSLTPTSTPTQNMVYVATGQTADGCILTDSVFIQVDLTLPNPIMDDTLQYCVGLSGNTIVSGATTYTWSPQTNITPVTGSSVTISTQIPMYYYCDFSNACGVARDSIWVETSKPDIQALNDTIVCPGEIAFLQATGGNYYEWSPAVFSQLMSDGSLVQVKPNSSTTYIVTGYNGLGCTDTAHVQVDLFPSPFVQTSPNVYAVFGEVVELTALANQSGTYVWSPAEYLSCTNCQTTFANPNTNVTYTVTFYDLNGCKASDQVFVSYEPLIYVPNTFTPNVNGINEFFFAQGVNIRDFKMEIYNRWGELIFTSNSLSESWDGTYAGLPCPDGVYTWKIEYGDLLSDMRYRLVGHVNLLR